MNAKSLVKLLLLGAAVKNRRGIVSTARRVRGKKGGGSAWVVNNLHWLVPAAAVLYLWQAIGNLFAAVGVALLFTVAVLGGWFWWRAKKTGVSWRTSVQELQRRQRLHKQWPKALAAAGIKVPVKLRRLTGDKAGDLSATVSGGQVPPETLMKAAPTLAPMVGCREVSVKQVGYSGAVKLRFLWSDPLAEVIKPAQIRSAPAGVAPIGVNEFGKVHGIPVLNSKGESIFTPTLIGGISGSGKSTALWALLGGFLVLGVPVRLRVIDPAGGVELAALQQALDPDAEGGFRVHRYASTWTEGTKVIEDAHKAMHARLRSMAGQTRAHKPTLAEPLDLIVIDEFLQSPATLKKADSKLAEVMSLGRKAGYSVVALTQIGHADSLGAIRELFAERLVFATRTREQTVTILGSGQADTPPPAHRIDKKATPGVGYQVNDDGAVRFRTVFYDDAQVHEIAHGHVPRGMERFGQVEERVTHHALYRFYTPDRQLAYVGETNDPRRRLEEHRKGSPWFKQVDPQLTKVVWFETKAEALAAEREAVERELPLWNTEYNRSNPLRRVSERVLSLVA